MAVIYDKEMGDKPFAQVLDREYYSTKCFKYNRIWQYHREESRILSDLDTIPMGNVDLSGRATILFRHNPRSKVITHSVMEWIMTNIAARLILQREICWCNVPVKSLKRHELQIEINIPVKSL